MPTWYTDKDLAHLRREGVPAELPEWLFGHSPAKAGAFAQWEQLEIAGTWRLRNVESVSGEIPYLLRVSRLGSAVDPGNVDAYSRLLRLSKYDHLSNHGVWDAVVDLHERVAATYPDDLGALLTSVQALLGAAETSAELPALAASIMGDWFAQSDAPNVSLHLIEQSDALGARYAMVRALLQQERPKPAEHHTTFSSSIFLMNDVQAGLDAYLQPLLTSLSPRVWGVTATRAGGVILLSLGAPLRGHRPLTGDALSLAGRRGGLEAVAWDTETPGHAFRDALTWWVQRLDLVFSHLTEPSNYEVGAMFNAPAALERLVNFEQICRSCQSIATLEDDHARRLALFHVLDALSGLVPSLTWKKLTSPRENRMLLEKLRGRMTPAIQAVLLPRADAAITALEALQTDFFLPSRVEGTSLVRPDQKGVETAVPLATAASEWLRVIRNSQHGYDKTPSAQDRALLAAHTGQISPHLADLAWLNLLRVLAFPEILKRHPRS